jgi:hypothetical protein
MKHIATSTLAVLLLLSPALRAEDTEPQPGANDATTLRAEAQRLHEESLAIRRVADEQRIAGEKSCWKKFLVQACLDEVGQTFRNERSKANALESRARGIERELKRRDVAERDAKQAAKEAAKVKP